MQLQVFAVPMVGDEAALEQVNAFLRSHRVLSVDKTAVVHEGRQFWSFCVEYLVGAPASAPGGGARSGSAGSASGKARIDYREVLTAPQFARFSKLRELRKQLADSESVPLYALFTNAQLADMARTVPKSKKALAEIDGVGEAKVKRYAEPLLALLRAFGGPEDETTPGGGSTGEREGGAQGPGNAGVGDRPSAPTSAPVAHDGADAQGPDGGAGAPGEAERDAATERDRADEDVTVERDTAPAASGGASAAQVPF